MRELAVMGEGDVVSENPENGNAKEDVAETIMDKEGEQHDEIKEMEVDKLDAVTSEAENMDIDKDEVTKRNKCNEKPAEEKGKEESAADREELETKAYENLQETIADEKLLETEDNEKSKETEVHGKDQETEADGKDHETEEDGKDQETEADGKDQKTEADGKDQETEADGKDQKTEADGKDQNTETDGKDQETEVDGKDQETEVNGEEQEIEADAGEQGTVKVEKEEMKNEESAEEETKNIAEHKVEEEANGVKEEEENKEETGRMKESKKRPRTKNSAGLKENHKKISNEIKEKEPITPNGKREKEPKTSSNKKENETKDKELKTPVTYTTDRPVRERKSVDRLVATIERDSAKEFHISKGRGTALKDIPNVAYKLSRKKTEDTLKLLHTILFGRRGKGAQVKINISRFSGFVWNDNEEKQMIKLKEKLDKCVKEKLVEFCDVLDIPISMATARKEDIIAKLIEFLLEPLAATSELLVDKEQEHSNKGKKRKRVNKSPGSRTPSKGSAKSVKKTGSASKKGTETKGTPRESEDESGEEEEDGHGHGEEGVNGISERSDDEMSEQAMSEDEKSESEKEHNESKGKQKQGSAKSPAKKGASYRSKTQKKTISKKASAKIVTAKSKVSNTSVNRKPSSKKEVESVKKLPALEKSASKEGPGKKVLKVKDKLKEEKLKPSDDKLKNAICEILTEVDFNTATFTDILKLLAKQFDTDLTPRKSSIKMMIQGELTKLADAEDDDEEEGDAE